MGIPTGIRLGQALADIQANARIKAAAVVEPATQAAKDRYLTHIMERFEQEIAPTIAPFLQDAIDHPDTPENLRTLFKNLAEPKQQVGFIFDILALIGIIITGTQAAAAGPAQQMRNQSLHKDPFIPLDVGAVAMAVVKGRLDEGKAFEEARYAGLRGEMMRVLIETTGNAPGPAQLGMMLTRGIIDEGRFVDGIKQGDIRNEWSGELAALRYSPMPGGDAVAAAVEGHISTGELATILSQNGIDPKWADIMYQTAGRPPGPQEMLELMNRGEMSQGEVEQAIRESDIKNKYIPALIKLARRIPPMDNVRQAVARGSLDSGAGVKKLMELGYNNEDAQILINEALARKHQATKDLAQSQIVGLYEIQAIDNGTAAGMLSELGFDSNESGFILALADSRRLVQYQNAAISRVHGLYVNHHIDRTQASLDMDGFGLPSTQRDALITLWDLERAANIKPLTLAQASKAFKDGIIEEAEYLDILNAMGYSERNSNIIAGMVGAGPLANSDITAP
jgi:hypothetical protein